MFRLIKENKDFNSLVYDYVADTYEELIDAPMGSTAYVIQDGAVYICNGNKEWVELQSGGQPKDQDSEENGSIIWAELDAFFVGSKGSSAAGVYGFTENTETGKYEYGYHVVQVSDSVNRPDILMPMINGVASWNYTVSPASGKNVVSDSTQSQGITTESNRIVRTTNIAGNRLALKVIDDQPAI